MHFHCNALCLDYCNKTQQLNPMALQLSTKSNLHFMLSIYYILYRTTLNCVIHDTKHFRDATFKKCEYLCTIEGQGKLLFNYHQSIQLKPRMSLKHCKCFGKSLNDGNQRLYTGILIVKHAILMLSKVVQYSGKPCRFTLQA